MNRIAWVIAALALCLHGGSTRADVVVVVPAGATLTTLGKQQVTDLFLGKADRFPDGSYAVPIDQAEGSSARDEFYLRFAGRSPAQIKAHWSKIIFTGRGQPPKAVAGSVDVKKLLARTPNGIAYIEQSLVDGSVKVLLAE